jgi:hypothetical protein
MSSRPTHVRDDIAFSDCSLRRRRHGRFFIADDADWRISEDVDGFADGGVG